MVSQSEPVFSHTNWNSACGKHTHTKQRCDDMMAEQSVENLTFRRWRYKHYFKFVEIYCLLLLQVHLKCRINLLLSAEVQ